MRRIRRKAIGRAISAGVNRRSPRVTGETVMYASRARKRPAARSTASASGRRPISRASAMASSCAVRWLRRTASV